MIVSEFELLWYYRTFNQRLSLVQTEKREADNLQKPLLEI